MSGKQLYTILLEKYSLQCEMAAGNYVIAMTSIMDVPEGFERLAQALEEIDEGKWRNVSDCEEMCMKMDERNAACHLRADTVMSASEAEEQPGCYISFEKSSGRIAKEYRYVYPPGIPLLVPGERITQEVVDIILEYNRQGLDVLGAECGNGQICVIQNLLL